MSRILKTVQSLCSITNNIPIMSRAAGKTSLSADGSQPRDGGKPRQIRQFEGLSRPSGAHKLTAAPKAQLCQVEPLSIQVDDELGGFVAGFLHVHQAFAKGTSDSSNQSAAILLSGAGGGVTGPSSVYLGIAEKLASLQKGIPCLRLDYRYPARNRYCVRDVLASMALLQDMYGIKRFVLVGWSFGGAPVFTVAGKDQRVVGCATVASQTAETEGIRRLAPRPVLLLHGTGDRTLSSVCSERLYEMYGSKGRRKLKFFEGDDHSLTKNAQKAEEILCGFIAECADLEVDGDEREVLGHTLVEDGERLENMKKGGDLAGQESVH
jgi:alpha/beta superfamily hydrolase